MFIDSIDTEYTDFVKNGVICTTISAMISILAILYLLIFKRPKGKQFQCGHIFGYFISLLVAHGIQSFSIILNFVWVGYNAVMEGTLCNIQGGLRNLGNISAAFWTLMIAVQLFNLLFIQWKPTRWGFWTSMALCWGTSLFIIMIGPAAIEKPGWPAYFGPDGAWCWITDTYQMEQIFLEYFLEYLCIIISTILYAFITLRVRGNLLKMDGKWRLQKVTTVELWNPNLGNEHDRVDPQVVRMARILVWFPIAYMGLLMPATLARFCQWSGSTVPFQVTVLTEIVFNLNGAVDVALLLYIEYLFPSLEDHTMVKIHKPKVAAEGATVRQLQNADGEDRRRGVYIAYPERAHFPTYARRLSADSAASDESWGHDMKDMKDFV